MTYLAQSVSSGQKSSGNSTKILLSKIRDDLNYRNTRERMRVVYMLVDADILIHNQFSENLPSPAQSSWLHHPNGIVSS